MKQTKKIFGMLFILVALLMLIYEKLTTSIRTMLVHLYCGAGYMKKVDGIIADPSCSFNINMYLNALFTLILIVGVILLISIRSEQYSGRDVQ